MCCREPSTTETAPRNVSVDVKESVVVPVPAAVDPSRAAVVQSPAAFVPSPAAVVLVPAAVVPSPAAFVPSPAAIAPGQAAVVPSSTAVVPSPAKVSTGQVTDAAVDTRYTNTGYGVSSNFYLRPVEFTFYHVRSVIFIGISIFLQPTIRV